MKRKKSYLLLAIVALVLIISATGLWIHNRAQAQARETVLRQTLHTMRKLIEDYATDQRQLPHSLQDLLKAGYMAKIPVDPLTEKQDWRIETGEDTVSVEGGIGIKNIRSNAAGKDSQGVPYSAY